MDLRPFHALRYDDRRVRLSQVVAPPYDVIDEAHRDALYARDPHNVIRLILNRDADRYGSAAAHLSAWVDAGVLRQDDTPALWLYGQTFHYGNTEFVRTGIIGTVRLEPFSSGHIRPHERTLSGPKEDRMRLIEACQTNLSPIFGLYADQRRVLDEARQLAERGAPAMDVTDEFAVRHRVWRISNSPQLDTITRTLGAQTIFIADGHHRYETALAYRDRLHGRGGLMPDDPANFIMMYLCSMDDPGLLVLPTHRLLRGVALRSEEFLAALSRNFHVNEFPRSAAGQDRLLAALATNGSRGHFGVALADATALYEITPRSAAAIDQIAPELPPEVRHIDVTLLDRLILRGMLGLDPDAAARAGQLRYCHDTRETFDAVDARIDQVAFLLGPPDLAQVEAVCRSGETMPQKSTYFYPKLLTGLVFHTLMREVQVSVVEDARSA
ncbi:MAG: DUF1015 domain-containing protein [Deltaproteobacteria bacterium]|nr:DUF1015 domain-containing protein [Deltaproteobacteria bacterium]MBI3386430.1 DUF1015 domain-containing protein [Deltaproteobacteria bacterium]